MKLSSRYLVWVVLMLALMLAATPVMVSAVDLKLKPADGQTYAFTVTTEDRTEQSGAEPPDGRTEITETDFTLTVLGSDSAGNVTFDLVYEALRYTEKQPYGEMHYDSEDGSPGIPEAMAYPSAMLHQPVRITMSPPGKVVEVGDLTDLHDVMLSLLGGPFVENPDLIPEQIEQVAGAQAWIETVQGVLRVFPSKAVNVGDSWAFDDTLSARLPALVHRAFTLKNVEGNQATIEETATVSPLAGAAPVTMGGAATRFELSGTVSGKVLLEVSSGLPLRYEMDRQLKATLTPESTAEGQPAQSQELTISSKATIERTNR